ncbi:hypothetical protein STRDD11_00225 [Streptococcus sp. DD11]|uniref:hypothetical protein n=1 Tax=Streptococcus sp. DD11 TaxID=1777879 RepID=UPI000796AAF9|nr:hypothetical protein [Streptococcus sp. DD11]KXT85733.1 hypothetical protein STRDD11_00225 [Streptococcus sp. DD11]
MGVVLLLSLLTWTLYRYCNKQYYGQYHQYTGKAKIDDYEIIADGAGAIVHWVSTTPEEDKKMEEFSSYASYKIDQNSSRYILRQNVKLKELPYRLMERPSDGAYWTLSVYHIDGNKLQKEDELDLYDTVENYDSDYLPRELRGIYRWNSKEYLGIDIHHINDRQGRKTIFLDLKTRKIEEIKSLTDEFPLPKVSLFNYWYSNESGINTIPGSNQFSINKKVLDNSQFEENTSAYRLLDKKETLIYILTAQNSAEKYSKEARIYSLFLPSINPFKNTTIPPELSVDSQEHIVNSKEEFDRYYGIEKAKKLYHETE